MKFGKIHDIGQVDFSLPDEPESNKTFLSTNLAAVEGDQLLLGCPVWADKSFIGKIYPQGSKSQDFLKFYGQSFRSVELNSTYYALPSTKTINEWKAKVPKDFKFCPKVPQDIANEKTLCFGKPEVREFFSRMSEFGPNLGPILLQLGPYFRLERWKYLVRFIRSVPKSMTLAIEFRHPDWFDPSNFNKLIGHLRSFGVIFVITDVAGRRDVCHLALTSNQSMIRFTGNGLDKTDFERVKVWANMLSRWCDLGLTETYFFIHQPVEGDCVDTAIDFVKCFEAISNKKLSGPKRLKETGQMGLF